MIDKVRIGPIEYDVVMQDEIIVKGLEEQNIDYIAYGEYAPPSATISIKTGSNKQYELTVLWHEISHGLLENAGIINDNEGLVTALGYALVDLIRVNPNLIEYTLNELKEQV